ncbi:DnaJ domain-containing protein [Waterburya agarophytonicola K14]|uniref:DnaJ domain-containing protein n=1 Tax=Waterburya agarophytonicola KI4 TaxID=2874699 RepID=A0A964BNS8_9CYAN|nr:DnaJ domain-containing protein [Waterburya agarophytonicola KI4]
MTCGRWDRRYRNYLDILHLNLPFSKQELKIPYRKKALETHPDTVGTTEAFREVYIAFEILSQLAS